jgi:hypothetical protein
MKGFTRTFIVIALSMSLVGVYSYGCAGFSGQIEVGDSIGDGTGTSGNGTDGSGTFEETGDAGDGGGAGAGTALAIDSVFPPDGSIGVVLGTSVWVKFAQAMDAATIHGGTVFVEEVESFSPSISLPSKAVQPSKAETRVTGTVTYDDANNQVDFALPVGEKFTDCWTHRIVVTPDALASDGAHFDEDQYFYFNSACPGMWTKSVSLEAGWLGSRDIAHSITVDDDDKVYIAGASAVYRGIGDYIYSTFVDQWDIAMKDQWGDGHRFDSGMYGGVPQPSGTAVVPDGAGGVYVSGFDNDTGAGRCETGGSSCMWMQRFDAAGEPLWGENGKTYGAPADIWSEEILYDIALDPIAGALAGVGSVYFMDVSGNIYPNMWVDHIGADGEAATSPALDAYLTVPIDGELEARAIAVDSSGVKYVAGSFIDYSAGGTATLFAVDAETFEPVALFSLGSDSEAYDIAVHEGDQGMAIFVVGYATDLGGIRMAVLLKYVYDDAIGWDLDGSFGDAGVVSLIGGPETLFSSLVLDDDGNIYVAGTDYVDASGPWWNSNLRQKMVVHKYDSSGTLITSYEYVDADISLGNAITLDAYGQVYVAGSSWIDPGVPTIYNDGEFAVWRFDADLETGGEF